MSRRRRTHRKLTEGEFKEYLPGAYKRAKEVEGREMRLGEIVERHAPDQKTADKINDALERSGVDTDEKLRHEKTEAWGPRNLPSMN